MSVLLAVTDLATGTYTVTRRAADSYDANGVLILGASSSFSILACVQPLSGRELKRLPEGRRTEEAKVIFTGTELQVEPHADRVSIGGEAFEVSFLDRWVESGAYYRAVLTKVAT